ncbi:hypothetical protein LJC47_02060 [Desulfosarcina sp. OttesenSCG-928-B08]|nr:hypothetical protein [Desulfosarcina sp. OttesenSCG-928-B08]
MLRKNAEVYTNDPDRKKILLTLSGNVLQFAIISSTQVQLTGTIGTPVRGIVSISENEGFPFRIVDVRAEKGENIAFDLKPVKGSGPHSYQLTIENTSTTAGRYADKLILTTDSPVKPTLTIWVYGQITSPGSE